MKEKQRKVTGGAELQEQMVQKRCGVHREMRGKGDRETMGSLAITVEGKGGRERGRGNDLLIEVGS